MNSGMLDTLFNTLLLLFWLRLWTDMSNREFTFNRYLAPLARASGAIVNFLRPVFMATPDRVMAVICLVFLLVFRAFLVPRGSVWSIHFGFVPRAADTHALGSVIAFSFASFLLFLFRLWSIAILYVRPHGETGAAPSALATASAPFNRVPFAYRPLVLLLFGAVIAWLLLMAGVPAVEFRDSGNPLIGLLGTIVQLIVIALAGWADVLQLLASLVMVLIIGTWVGMFAAAPGVFQVCRDWLDFLMGPVKRFPIRIGAIDFSPLVFFFVLGVVHYAIVRALLGSFRLLSAL